jgi:hypothetical protein
MHFGGKQRCHGNGEIVVYRSLRSVSLVHNYEAERTHGGGEMKFGHKHYRFRPFFAPPPFPSFLFNIFPQPHPTVNSLLLNRTETRNLSNVKVDASDFLRISTKLSEKKKKIDKYCSPVE